MNNQQPPPSNLIDQITYTKEQIQVLKITTPYIFPLYVELKRAEKEFEQAQEKVRELKEKWKNF